MNCVTLAVEGGHDDGPSKCQSAIGCSQPFALTVRDHGNLFAGPSLHRCGSAAFKPGMEQVLADKGSQVAAYFLMFPIESKHPDSRSAAQAVLAANQLGKFKEMHDKLFEEAPRHNRDNVTAYAKALWLDPAAFAKAYDASSGQVTSDLKQGEKAGVDSTPTLFFNDRKYEGPMHPRYIEMWIDEELAVNR